MPPTSVEPQAPSKKSASSTSPSGVGISPPAWANSPIQVVPIRLTSGVLPLAIAPAILLCAASHGIAVTLTVASGLASSKSAANSWSTSPSVPMAQTSMLPVALPSAIGPPCSWPASWRSCRVRSR